MKRKRVKKFESEKVEELMSFSSVDKLKALAVVRVFETSEPFGDHSAVAVLNDGAGVSYGISQFTHRSGSLAAVVERYLISGGAVGRAVLEDTLHYLKRSDGAAIAAAAGNERFKKALRAAGVTREMREAQEWAAIERYLKPAISACSGSRFMLPLSLAVVYDSMTHGSWEKIRDRVSIQQSAFGSRQEFEKAWITEYVRQRYAWLRSIPRLVSTSYRTKFFLDQIAVGRWDLKLPVNVHGVKLTDEMFRLNCGGERDRLKACPTTRSIEPADPALDGNDPAIDPPQNLPGPSHDGRREAVPAEEGQARSKPEREKGEEGKSEKGEKSVLQTVEGGVKSAAERYDRVERVVNAVVTRKDSAKSLWTTIVGTAWQSAWAVIGFLSGMPREVWLVAAVIAGVLMLLYLYRQVELGRIREKRIEN